ncbi:F-box/WD repeat-containing protein 9, partial [Ceratobasidium sp. 423]
MAIFKASPHPVMSDAFPVATLTFCHTARPSSSSSVLSITSATPSLALSSNSNSITSLEPIVPVGGFFYSTSMQQLDSNGYPTRALYYLHKRMLEVALRPELYHNQPWGLQIRPGTPIPASTLSKYEDEGIIAPDNSLEEGDILNVLEGEKQICSVEEDPVLHNLCATLVSAEYVTPPTPPTGATPCDTPPEFDPPTFTGHDEYACHIAKMVVSSSVTELDGQVVEEFQVELEYHVAIYGSHTPQLGAYQPWLISSTPRSSPPSVLLLRGGFMSFRNKAKKWKGIFKDAPQKGSSPAQSTSSLAGPSIGAPDSIPSPQPGPQTTSTATNSWTSLKYFIRVLDASANVFGSLKLVMDELLCCFEAHKNAAPTKGEYHQLKGHLQALFEGIGNLYTGNAPPKVTTAIENLCSALKKEISYISSRKGRNTRTRHVEASEDLDKILRYSQRIQSHLGRLKLNADLNVWVIVDEQATEARLDRIKSSLSACYNSAAAAVVRRRACTPKTREQVMVDLQLWHKDESAEKICWMSGMAGTGKTTIANTFCVALDQTHELAASFFATRLLPECRDIKLAVPTIAYQLARFSRPFRSTLSRVLERDLDEHTWALKSQFKNMVVGPLQGVINTLPPDSVVIIDALDECDDTDGVGQILEALSQLLLHELDDKVIKEDITTYLRTELARMSPPED